MLNFIIKELIKNKNIFAGLFADKTSAEYLWKVSSEKWCPLEMICHLVDEEVLDFRTRLQTVIQKPGTQPPLIDPVGWVKDKKYVEQNYQQKLQEFLNAREESITYLKSLNNPPLNHFYNHPTMGPLNGHVFLNNWLAHDFLHIKQITRWHYDFLNYKSSVPISYAGKWT
jgi:hypothetical protein